MRLSAAALGLLVALALGLAGSWMAGSAMVAGHASRVEPAVPPAHDVALRAADGTAIAATFRPGRSDRSPAVLLLHGVGTSRQTTAPNAAWLSSLGYATLAIDFRGHGESAVEPRTFGLLEAQDARAAFRWLKQRQRGAPVAIIGISLGGAATLLGSAGPVPADALVLQAVYPDIRHAIRNRIATRAGPAVAALLEPLLSFQAPLRFGVWPSRLSPLQALARYDGPVLVIGGEQDRSTPPAETRAMFAAARGPKALWLVPTGDHPVICDLATPAYRQHVAHFLRQTIGDPAVRQPASEPPSTRD